MSKREFLLSVFWPRVRFVALALSLIFYVFMGIAIERRAITYMAQLDFNVYWAAARLFTQNQNVYDGSLTRDLIRALDLEYVDGSDYIYPPYLAAVLSPVTHLHPLKVGFLWYLGSLIALCLAVWIILQGRAQSSGGATDPGQWSDSLLLALILAPIASSLYVGQINAFILLLLAAVYSLLEKGREILAGTLLAVSILLKVAPIVVLVYMFVRKKYIALICTTVVVTGIVLVTAPIFEPHLSTYSTTVLLGLSMPEPNPVNQSLNGFFSRALTKNDFTVPIVDAPFLSRSLTLLASVAFVLLTVAKLVPPESTPSESHSDVAFGSLVTLIPIISPLGWETLYVLLAFPLIAVFCRWERINRSERFLFGTSLLLITAQRLWGLFAVAPGRLPILRYFWPLMSLGLYGVVTLLFLQTRIRNTNASPNLKEVPCITVHSQSLS